MLTAGIIISFIKVREGRERVRAAKRRFDAASLIEERIRLAKEPLFDIISPEELSHLKSEDAECGKLIERISLSDYSSALSYAGLLKNHTEKEMQKIADNEEKTREAKLILPPAASLLAVILLI